MSIFDLFKSKPLAARLRKQALKVESRECDSVYKAWVQQAKMAAKHGRHDTYVVYQKYVSPHMEQFVYPVVMERLKKEGFRFYIHKTRGNGGLPYWIVNMMF